MNKKVLLFLAQGFEALEASVFTDILGWTHEAGNKQVDLTTTAFHSKLRCSWNLIVEPELPFDQIKVSDYDALAIPGGMEWAGFYEDAYDERLLNLIREFNREGKIIASICVSALALGKSGVLENRNATTWDLNEGKRLQELAAFGANIINQSVVIDKNIITSNGPASGPEVAFTLLEMLTDKESTEAIKLDMRFKNSQLM
jgi:4-methyl-5(b-hydroxyethyl)-thiazole monophosphate biosynthesis